MQHLTLEALARLVDETAAAEEAAHLDGCAACRAELEELRRQSAALARLGPIEPAGAAWQALEARLAQEGLLAGSAKQGMPPGPAHRFGGWMPGGSWGARLLRLAAALALYGVGTATGMALRGRPAPETAAPAAGARTGAPLAVATQPVRPGPVASAEPAADTAAAAQQVAPEPATRPSGHLVADVEPRTPAEALRAVRAAEAEYLHAYSRYSELVPGQQQDEDLIARAAALESMVLTTRAALERAPADPVINGYHLTAVAQRDAALRQIALRSKDGRWF